LEILDIGFNNIGKESAIAIGNALLKNTKLAWISLSRFLCLFSKVIIKLEKKAYLL